MGDIKLVPPCAYQGGKQRIAKDIVDIFLANNTVDENTKFFDICCGSGAISLELINRGMHPTNITMVDIGGFGAFWNSVANDEFDLEIFKQEINKIPSVDKIQQYLKDLSNQPIDQELLPYHYLILQCGAFGSKQVWIKGNKYKNNTFRSYWLPTETSNRRSPVNPMMPMPNILYSRVCDIVEELGGIINAINGDIFNVLHIFDEIESTNAIIYIDPPYQNTTAYGDNFNIYELIQKIQVNVPIYVSEGYKMEQSKNSYLISSGRKKGNISGNINKKPSEEWLNLF